MRSPQPSEASSSEIPSVTHGTTVSPAVEKQDVLVLAQPLITALVLSSAYPSFPAALEDAIVPSAGQGRQPFRITKSRNALSMTARCCCVISVLLTSLSGLMMRT